MNKVPIDEWEEIPDEDLWEDGELTISEVKTKIMFELQNTGNWKLMRRKNE